MTGRAQKFAINSGQPPRCRCRVGVIGFWQKTFTCFHGICIMCEVNTADRSVNLNTVRGGAVARRPRVRMRRSDRACAVNTASGGATSVVPL